jgi:CRAL/TRIO domain
MSLLGATVSTMAPQPPPTKSGWSRRTVTEDTLEDELEQVDHDETTLVSAASAAAKEQRFLREACGPHATVDECARFAEAWSKDWEQARANLQSYLDWKRLHSLDSIPSPALADGEDPNQFDVQLWSLAMEKAYVFHQQQAQESIQTDSTAAANAATAAFARPDAGRDQQPQSQPQLPPILVAPVRNLTDSPVTCRDGHRLLAVWPARLPLLALHNEPLHTYTTCLALYLYYTLIAPFESNNDNDTSEKASKTSRTTQKVTILVDCRAGTNWPNVPVYKMYGFVQHVCQVLRRLFPGLVHRVLVAPIPTIACWAYKIMAPLLDADLRRLVHLVAGPSTSCTAVLPSSLESILAPSDLAWLESLRQNATSV